MKETSRRAAVEGETFTYSSRIPGFHALTGEHTVCAKSEGNAGQWVCIACGEPLANNFEKDSHCESRPSRLRMILTEKGPRTAHVLAWRSFNSGKVEVP